jgi:hypothetical protein
VDSNNNWGYCSIDGDSKYLTEKGYYCATECEMNGEDYFWCGHHGGWGYCSRTENSDSHGRACRTDHDCARHDGTYTPGARETQMVIGTFVATYLQTVAIHLKKPCRMCRYNKVKECVR